MATCSPLGRTVGSHRDCSVGGLCVDASNTTNYELFVMSRISESKEIAEPIPPLEAGKALTMVSASVKLNDTKCEPVMHLKYSSGSIPDGCSTALKRHRPLMRQFYVTKNLNQCCIAYMRDHHVKGHYGQIDDVRKLRLPEIKESKGHRTNFDATAVVCALSLSEFYWKDPDPLNKMSRPLPPFCVNCLTSTAQLVLRTLCIK